MFKLRALSGSHSSWPALARLAAASILLGGFTMGRTTTFATVLLVLMAVLFFSPVVSAQTGGIATHTGALADGATYLIEVPTHWNGTLFLYSHGYVTPGAANPATDGGDPATRAFMLGSGFALAGSSYATTGWAIQQALPDQIAVLEIFNKTVAHPKRTIAWGHSLGGMITAGLIQRYPEKFDAALPMCGVLSGGVPPGTRLSTERSLSRACLLREAACRSSISPTPWATWIFPKDTWPPRRAPLKAAPALHWAQLSAIRRDGSLPCRRSPQRPITLRRK